MRIYLPVKFELDWTKTFSRKDSGNENVDPQTNARLHHFRKQPNYDGDLCRYQV